MLSSQEIRTLINAMGTVRQDDFDIAKLATAEHCHDWTPSGRLHI